MAAERAMVEAEVEAVEAVQRAVVMVRVVALAAATAALVIRAALAVGSEVEEGLAAAAARLAVLEVASIASRYCC